MTIPFIKMNGAGNDFVILDNRKNDLPDFNWRKLADRQFGIGCDQGVVLEKSDKADIRMRIFNADGGEIGSCGNASRCVGWLIYKERRNGNDKPVSIETNDGIIEARITDENRVTIDMGMPRMEWASIPLKEQKDVLHLGIELGALKDPVGVSMGNPHMVFFVEDVWKIPLHELGPKLEYHALFPKRANVSVARVDGWDRITLRVWERGAGLTLACGTAACATLVAANLRGLCGRSATVILPGGELIINWREGDHHVLMTGPVATNYSGSFEVRAYVV